MAPPICVAINSFERNTSLLVRSGGSSKPRYVQKCTEEGSRLSCVVADSGKGGYWPINLWTHSGHGLPLRSVHVVACVTEGVSGIAALSDAGEETISWQAAGVMLNRELRTARTRAQQNQCFTIAPLAMAYDVSVTAHAVQSNRGT